MRREVDAFFQRFQTFLRDSGDLSWRALFSPNAEMYECVRKHLAEKAPPAAAPLMPLKLLPLLELSVHLPHDWADFCEPCLHTELAPPSNHDELGW
mmetsp:Transcript_63363/g.205689  ORF Transcript_63363/g.205689 Transcript_63363/m.205689 type:complete len:96 (-) Transcript_63363:164-451(-)